MSSMAAPLDVLLETSREALREESDVIDRLTARAEKYLGAIGLILAFHAIEIDKLDFSTISRGWPSLVVVVGAGLLALSLVIALASMHLRSYPTYADTEELLKLTVDGVSGDVATLSVVHMLLKTRDGVRRVNEERAKQVTASGLLLVVGFVATIGGQVWLQIT